MLRLTISKLVLTINRKRKKHQRDTFSKLFISKKDLRTYKFSCEKKILLYLNKSERKRKN
jgi:hypothetical protein